MSDVESGDNYTEEELELIKKAEEEAPPHQEEVKVETEQPVTPPPPPLESVEKMVPLAALHQSRAETRLLRQQLQMQEQLRQEILEMKQKMQPPPPSFDDDPKAALVNEFNSLKSEIAKRDAILQDLHQQTVLKQQQDNFINTVTAQVDQFRAVVPDYDNAYNFVTDLKRQELATMGIVDPMAVNDEINKLAYSFSVQALNSGRNPAQLLYKLAKTYGYKSPATQTAAGQPNQPPTQPVSERFETIAKGQQASRSLTGGESADASPTLKALLDADGPDFDKMWDQVFPKKSRF